MFKDKGLIIGILATVILIVGGVFLMTRGDSGSSGPGVSSEILVPSSSYVLGGIENGEYLPSNPSSKVTLVEFGDYECPACVVYHPFVKQVLTEFSGKVNYVFRNYPLSYHQKALVASYAVEAAGLQDKFWQMHDKVFESSEEWVNSTNTEETLLGYAKELGIDIEKFKNDIESDFVKNRIKSNINDGDLVKLDSTPTFYVNGVKMERLNGSYLDFKSVIQKALSN